jgi:hypothetical protein
MVAAVMAVAVHFTISRLPTLLALPLAIVVGVAVYLALIRINRVLSPDDHGRMLSIKNHLPAGARSLFEAGVNWLIAFPASGSYVP